MKFLSSIVECMKKSNSDSNNLSIGPNEYLYLRDEDGSNSFALISYAPDLKEDLLEQFENGFYDDYGSQYNAVSGTVIDQLGPLVPIISSGLNSRGLMQIVGPSEVVEGLANGTMKLMKRKDGTGFLGEVLNEGSSKIFKQATFAEADLARIVAPGAIYRIFNAAAGTYQLSQINARLDSLQRAIDSIVFRQQANEYGRLCAAITTLEEIGRQYSVMGRFTDDMRNRLILATQEIIIVNNESRIILERFQRKSEELMATDKKKSGLAKATKILEEEKYAYMLDANIYMTAAKAGLIADEIWLKHDLQFAPEYIGYRMRDLELEVSTIKEAVSPMESIYELQYYAVDCLKEMGKLGRLFHPNFKRKVKDIKEQLNNEEEPIDEVNNAQSLYIWLDKNNQIKMLSATEMIQRQLK